MKRGLFIFVAFFFYNCTPAYATLETGAAELKQSPIARTTLKINKFSMFYTVTVICNSTVDGLTPSIDDATLEDACLKSGYDHLDKAHIFKNACESNWPMSPTGIIDFRCVALPEL